MTGSFRFIPPEPRPDALARPRLLRVLVGRWRHAVTTVVGGAGLGKTTLLAQAVAENHMAPRGDDVWVGVEAHDSDVERLARVVAAAVARSRPGPVGPGVAPDDPPPTPVQVADTIWQRSPQEVCLVLDDVHRIPAGSTSAAWLGQLLADLPGNAHLVLSGRTDPPVALDDLASAGGLLRLTEDDLRFDDEELVSFASQRGLDPFQFDRTGGWPAMVELIASLHGGPTRSTAAPWENYLWEEVLDPLGPESRHVLAVLCDLGGADDALVSAALGRPVELTRTLRGVPLVARDDGGWHAPHALWRNAPGIALAPHDRQAARRRAVEHHVDRGNLDEAFRLVIEAELWDVAPDVLRRACLAYDRLARGQLGRWLAACPDDVRGSLAGCLAHALDMVFTEPVKAYEPLKQAVDRCRDGGDVDAELIAIAQLGRLAAWRQDLVTMVEVGVRLTELEETGRPRARGLAAYARVVAADVRGDDEAALRELDSIRSALDRARADGDSSDAISVDPLQEVLMAYLRVMLHLDRGEPDLARAEIERLRPTAALPARYVLDLLELRIWWTEGRFPAVLRRFPDVLATAQATGETYPVYLGHSYACLACSQAGDVAEARRCREESLDAAPPPAAGELSVYSAMATASLRLAEGDEAAAAAVLRQAVEDHGLDRGFERRGWRHALPLSYVLLPETRAHWDAQPLQGYLATSRGLAAAVVAARSGNGSVVLRRMEVPDAALVQSLLHYRFATELALGLTSVGRPEGRLVLDRLGLPGRAALRALADTRPRQVKAARSLLAAVPAPPSRPTYLAVLGPLVLRRDGPEGEEVVDPSLRRRRLQALIGFLVAHRRTTRQAIAEALWPELDERAAGNNLAVTLNRLLRVLEPWRDAREPPYLVRLEGQAVSLLAGEHLGIDVDDFGNELAAAAQAEAGEAPSEALDHLLAAVELYRDDLHVELLEADWFALDREHYRTRFVTAATRAGQLLVGRGDMEQAQHVARRALAVDPWCEDAYGVLINAALAYDDRSAARRVLMHCLAALHDLGAQPSPTTQQLHRRIQGIPTRRT